ncbi:hypothetical protein ACFE04_021927 [Oxalis oulophora]
MTSATSSPPCLDFITTNTITKLTHPSPHHHRFIHLSTATTTTTSISYTSVAKTFTYKPTTATGAANSQFGGSTAGEDPEDILTGMFYGRNGGTIQEDEDDDDDDDDDDDTESSFDLFFRFMQSLFKKVSKRAKKASRSVLPPAISPEIHAYPHCGDRLTGRYQVSFAVDGILLLASLSIIKALLEVICTLGGTVFAVIMILRLIWTAVAYFQSRDSSNINGRGASFGTT